MGEWNEKKHAQKTWRAIKALAPLDTPINEITRIKAKLHLDKLRADNPTWSESTIRRAIKANEIRYIVVRNRYKIAFSSMLKWSQKKISTKNKQVINFLELVNQEFSDAIIPFAADELTIKVAAISLATLGFSAIQSFTSVIKFIGFRDKSTFSDLGFQTKLLTQIFWSQ